jgi:hypothetical protein
MHSFIGNSIVWEDPKRVFAFIFRETIDSCEITKNMTMKNKTDQYYVNKSLSIQFNYTMNNALHEIISVQQILVILNLNLKHDYY